ncbi:hypothetical protein IKF63_01215 [Candidatus Saccharibacteria bacterium]|nr:hypothetical protein [Candidatus Saccharibacteria bacterium]MBR3180682.1 hypothetical protein [Candidatus Saccharibacteria bacterium]
MKNIKVKRLDDSNSVNVRIEHSAKMATTVDKLLKLDDYDFRKVIVVSKKYRKANKAIFSFLDDESVKIKIQSNKANAIIVNNLVDLGKAEFRKAIKCAKQYRHANKLLDSAISNYVGLKKEDHATIQSRRMGLAYEAS